ncbi:phage tail tape measure protein [Enterococcus sp. LJL128]
MNGEVEYAKTVKQINNEMNLAAAEYKRHVSAMDSDATATEKLRATKEKLEKQLQLAERRTALLREEYEKSVRETGEYSEQSQKLYKQLVNSETGENKLRSALEATNEALEEQGNLSISTAEKLQKIEEAGDKIKGVGEKLSILSAGIVGIGAASLSAFNEVDEALDTIIVKTGATGEQADRLAESFENVAGNTHLELQTVGEAIGEVNTQFGFLDEQLESSTDYMLMFAEINDTDVSQSAISARQSIEAYGLEYSDLNSVLDSVTKTAQNTGQSVDKLFDAAVKGAPQLKALDLSFGESVAILGKFEQSGVDSSKMISYLSKASVTYAKDNKNLIQGLEETSNKLSNATSEAEALTIASEVFGTKGAAVVEDAIKRGALNFDGLAESAASAGGAVEDTFGATLDPIDEANRAMNNAKLAMASVGESVQIALLPFFNAAIDALKKFKGWLDSLDDGQKQMVVTIGMVVAAIGPVLVIIGTLMGSVTKIITGVKAFIGVWQSMITFLGANPFILVIAAIAALIAGLVWAYQNVKWFRDGVNAFFQGVSDVAVEIFNYLAGFFTTWFDGFMNNINNFYEAAKKVFTGIVDFITGVFTGDWGKAWEGVVSIFDGIVSGIVAVFKAPINSLITLINSFIGGLNSIKVPKWVPGVGGKGINISKIPYLAKGGHLLQGQAIVGEAGPELLTAKNGKTTVTPLSDDERRKGISGATNTPNVYQTVNIGKVDANNPSELSKVNRQVYQAGRMAAAGTGGV